MTLMPFDFAHSRNGGMTWRLSDWQALIKAHEQFPNNEDISKWVNVLRGKYGSVEHWPVIRCNAGFVPDRKGASQVVELKLPSGEWTSVTAERMPQQLGDAIKGQHAKYYPAQKTLARG